MTNELKREDHYDLFSLAETALKAGYDGTTIEIRPCGKRKGKKFFAVARRKTLDKAWNAVNEVTAYDETEDAVRFELSAALTKLAMKNAAKAMLDAMPREAKQAHLDWAIAVLSVENTVVLGSRDSTPADIAGNILMREHYNTVTDIVEDIKNAIEDGDYTDADSLREFISETVGGHHDVIYTACAKDILRYSDNDEAYYEQTGEDQPDWSTLAAPALEADVMERLTREGIDVDALHTVECARCGTVPSTEDESTETDCPKCGLSLSVERREGFTVRDDAAELVSERCKDCHDPETWDTGESKPMAPNTEYECSECGEELITPPAPTPAPEPKTLVEVFADQRSGFMKNGDFVCDECSAMDDRSDYTIVAAGERYRCGRCDLPFVAPPRPLDE